VTTEIPAYTALYRLIHSFGRGEGGGKKLKQPTANSQWRRGGRFKNSGKMHPRQRAYPDTAPKRDLQVASMRTTTGRLKGSPALVCPRGSGVHAALRQICATLPSLAIRGQRQDAPAGSPAEKTRLAKWFPALPAIRKIRPPFPGGRLPPSTAGKDACRHFDTRLNRPPTPPAIPRETSAPRQTDRTEPGPRAGSRWADSRGSRKRAQSAGAV